MHAMTAEASLRLQDEKSGLEKVQGWNDFDQKKAVDSCFEEIAEKAEAILKRVRQTKDFAGVEKILPSFDVLNRLHVSVSSLLRYHH
jgi:hypothetical protein